MSIYCHPHQAGAEHFKQETAHSLEEIELDMRSVLARYLLRNSSSAQPALCKQNIVLPIHTLLAWHAAHAAVLCIKWADE
jgi:hypothetical protein